LDQSALYAESIAESVKEVPLWRVTVEMLG
jgi:hypothetical protein